MARVRRPGAFAVPEQLPLIAESTPEGVKRTRGKTLPPSKMRAVAAEMEEFIRTNRWEGARAIHFVALYLKLHLQVYGVEASDCGPAERLQAAGVAGKMLEREFNNDPALMVEFVRWVWQRESRAEKWRRENKREGRRIAWQLMFSNKLLTDYTVNLRRVGP